MLNRPIEDTRGDVIEHYEVTAKTAHVWKSAASAASAALLCPSQTCCPVRLAAAINYDDRNGSSERYCCQDRNPCQCGI